MTDHKLTRNQDNFPVCTCGYISPVITPDQPIGLMWKAKADVLNHITDVRNGLAPETTRPDAPFVGSKGVEMKYPRAGVRQTAAGTWLLTCWDSATVFHPLPEPEFNDRKTAFDYGYLTIGACRDSGTNLNGIEAA
ncbi:hypothetical protein [Arthrobacter sp. ISL-72]|uniref:hypothetical protein n=1 Tax=Arthrobacter sp. ISL-72 TaxID=2819114 RepID=UPI001BEBD66F|nr:hypothetical protein [Arthrobacter sp. ISL-72]MBT2594753.1 hypothetical protein [Arthrobacter sp. ISL-72]